MIPPDFKKNAPNLKKDVFDWMMQNNVAKILGEKFARKKDWDCDEYSWKIQTNYGRKLTVKTSHGRPYFAGIKSV